VTTDRNRNEDNDDEPGQVLGLMLELKEAYLREAGEAASLEGYRAFAKREREKDPERFWRAMVEDAINKATKDAHWRAVLEDNVLPGQTDSLMMEMAKEPERFFRAVATAVWEAGYPWNNPIPDGISGPLVRRLLRIQDAYIDACGSAGGTVAGFQQRVLLDREEDRAFYRRHATEALIVAKEARLRAAVEAGELVEVEAADATGRKLRVRREDTTEDQVREHAVRVYAKAGRLQREDRETMRLYDELGELAGGDEDAPLAPLLAEYHRRQASGGAAG
jgi:hypothetical protein